MPNLSILSSIYLSIYPSNDPSIHPSIYPSIHLDSDLWLWWWWWRRRRRNFRGSNFFAFRCPRNTQMQISSMYWQTVQRCISTSDLDPKRSTSYYYHGPSNFEVLFFSKKKSVSKRQIFPLNWFPKLRWALASVIHIGQFTAWIMWEPSHFLPWGWVEQTVLKALSQIKRDREYQTSLKKKPDWEIHNQPANPVHSRSARDWPNTWWEAFLERTVLLTRGERRLEAEGRALL